MVVDRGTGSDRWVLLKMRPSASFWLNSARSAKSRSSWSSMKDAWMVRFKFDVGVHFGGLGVGVTACDVVLLEGIGKGGLEFATVIRQQHLGLGR